MDNNLHSAISSFFICENLIYVCASSSTPINLKLQAQRNSSKFRENITMKVQLKSYICAIDISKRTLRPI